MSLLHRFHFRKQMILGFSVVILFMTVATFFMLHLFLRDSYRNQESASLETHVRQLAINIDNRLAYFTSFLDLLAADNKLHETMEQKSFQQVQRALNERAGEFYKQNIGRVNAIRVYRNSVYSHIANLGSAQSIFKRLAAQSSHYSTSVYITGTYLNERHEKVFSLFRKVYQLNERREYLLEMCLYETELFSFFNEDNSDNETMILCNGALISMSDRDAFSRLLYAAKEEGGGFVSLSQLSLRGDAVRIAKKANDGLEILIETNNTYLEKGYRLLLVRMIPVLCLVTALAFAFSGLLTKQLSRRLKLLQEKIADISSWELQLPLHIEGRDEFASLADELERTRLRILALIEQNTNTQRQMREAEMSALRAQINSHFLFNSLSSIKWLAKEMDMDKLEDAADSLALFLRHSLAIKDNQIRLEDELVQLTAYTNLQSLRYGDDVNVQIDIEPELMNTKTVRMVLQPLVENAIHHGRRGNGARLNIMVYSNTGASDYELTVEDDGNGISEETIDAIMTGKPIPSETGYGLCNVISRLQMCLGKPASQIVTIKSKPNAYTIITFRQPL